MSENEEEEKREPKKKRNHDFLSLSFFLSFLFTPPSLQHCRIFADGANYIDGLTWRSAPAAQVPALGAP